MMTRSMGYFLSIVGLAALVGCGGAPTAEEGESAAALGGSDTEAALYSDEGAGAAADISKKHPDLPRTRAQKDRLLEVIAQPPPSPWRGSGPPPPP